MSVRNTRLNTKGKGDYMGQQKKHHWFPLYSDAWVVGTRVLSYRQQGIYLQLLILQFESSRQAIDRQRAARVLNIDADDADLNEVLREKFSSIDLYDYDGAVTIHCYRNERMKEIVEEQAEKSKKRSASLERARKSKALKAQRLADEYAELHSVTERSNSATLLSDAGKELELELESELEVDSKERVTPDAGKPRRVNKRAKQYMDSWNEVARAHDQLTAIDTWSRRRQDKFRALVKAMGESRLGETWTRALAQLPIPNRESFKWQPTFDWCMSEGNLLKLAEGNYSNGEKTKSDSEKRTERVNDFLQW